MPPPYTDAPEPALNGWFSGVQGRLLSCRGELVGEGVLAHPGVEETKC
jgi:hypothetical protein